MKVSTMMMLVVLFLGMGSLSTACTKLNPNTESQLKAAIEARTDAFRVCFETALEKDRDTQGTVGLKLDIGAETGAVESSTVAETTVKDRQMNQCVADSASDITLEEPPGVPVEGLYDIEFSHL